MKILVLNWLDPENPQAGGAEVHLHEIFRRLVAWGHSVTLLCSAWQGCERRTAVDGIEVHRVGGRHSLSLVAPVYFRRQFRAERFDVVVEDLNKVPFFSPLWGVGAPVALIVHHLFGTTAFQEASLPVAAGDLATGAADSQSVPIRADHGRVRKHRGGSRATRNVPWRDRRLFPTGSISRPCLRSRPRNVFASRRSCNLGRLKRYKGVDLLLRAVASLVERGTPCRLLVAGSWRTIGYGRKALAKSLDLEQHVEFLGFISDGEKRDLLRKCWVNLLTSVRGGLGHLEPRGGGLWNADDRE